MTAVQSSNYSQKQYQLHSSVHHQADIQHQLEASTAAEQCVYELYVDVR